MFCSEVHKGWPAASSCVYVKMASWKRVTGPAVIQLSTDPLQQHADNENLHGSMVCMQPQEAHSQAAASSGIGEC